ncbi:HlyD family secretion protein [Aquabacterium sp.]|uniref:HlyD family secretion protein n=1 Tax=Aquabacterium sp. TaxID=1872578 RepID=UPI0025BBAD3E|nr:HlyD family secretion protein [Aquabacterium sp.]
MSINLPSRLGFPLLAIVAVLVAAGAAYATWGRPESESTSQATDDARIQADLTVMASQVPGVIAEVAVQDNQSVQAGQLLWRLDDRDLKVAVRQADARVASARAGLGALEAQILRHASEVQAAQATLTADQANLTLAQTNRQRFGGMAQDGSGTLQAQQQSDVQWQVARAALQRDEAVLESAKKQLGVLQAERERAQATLASAEAERQGAELRLSYARVTAPVPGVVASRSARVGSYVQVGQPAVTLVPSQGLYVDAHFRETQLAHIREGQAVTLTVDALPGVKLKGHVASLAPASGASLSPMGAQNATGNFTKIVQRLPVRIELDADQEALARLRVGMSVQPHIDVAAAAQAAPLKGQP